MADGIMSSGFVKEIHVSKPRCYTRLLVLAERLLILTDDNDGDDEFGYTKLVLDGRISEINGQSQPISPIGLCRHPVG